MNRKLIIKIKTYEDKDEVLKYLESKGEPVTYGFGVTSNWCYIAFLPDWNQWSLTDLCERYWGEYEHISKYDFLNNQSPHYEVY